MCAKSMQFDTAWVEERIAARQQACADKDWAAVDAIRNELLDRSVESMDGTSATTWRIRMEAPQEGAFHS